VRVHHRPIPMSSEGFEYERTERSPCLRMRWFFDVQLERFDTAPPRGPGPSGSGGAEENGRDDEPAKPMGAPGTARWKRRLAQRTRRWSKALGSRPRESEGQRTRGHARW